MGPQSFTTKVALSLGVLFYIGGILMMCYCPWTFAIAAVMFGATAAAANGRLRWYAVVFVATSVATSIGFAKRDAEFKERARANALEAIKKYEERQKGNSIQPDDPVISH